MKKIIFGIILAFSFIACDKIESPYIVQSQQESVDVVFPELNKDAVYRKILFDEYTGHKCSNCPDGHALLNQMLAQYGDTLVAVGIHAGYFAGTSAGVFSYNFSTPASEQLYTDYNIYSNPLAILNRVSVPLENNTWLNDLANADRSRYAAIQIINQYDASTKKLKINTKTTMLEDYGQSLLLSLQLVEDNIVKPQQVYSTVDTFYIHNHVLRAGINGTYGELITSDGLLSKDSSYLYGYSVDFNGKDWNPDNCSVIAILLDNESKKALQVEKCKVK
jgi:hypothetical protein